MDLIVTGTLAEHYDNNCHGAQAFLLAADVTRDILKILPTFSLVHEEYDARGEIDNSHTRITSGAYCIHNIPFEDCQHGDDIYCSVTIDRCDINGGFFFVANYRPSVGAYSLGWKSWSDMPTIAKEMPAWIEEMRSKADEREHQIRTYGRILPEEPCTIIGCVQRP